MAKVLAHPTRIQILSIAHQREICPSEFAKLHGKTTGTVSHHFKVLLDYGAIELIRKEPVRGSVRHWYAGTTRALFTDVAWPTFPESIQKGLATATLEDFMDVTARAIETGTFTGRDDFLFSWEEITLDELGWRKLGEMLRLVWKKIPSLEEETEIRKEKTGDKGIRVVASVVAFEAAKPKRSKTARRKRRKKGG